jgi:hypothetical protein
MIIFVKCLEVLFYGFYGKKERNYYSKGVIVAVSESWGLKLSI